MEFEFRATSSPVQRAILDIDFFATIFSPTSRLFPCFAPQLARLGFFLLPLYVVTGI